MPSPWSWQPGPPPFGDATLTPTASSSSRTWHRAVWAGELTFAIGKVASPGLMDILVSCRIKTHESVSITTSAVRRATRSLRWHHPAIGINVAFPPMESLADFKPMEGKLVYECPVDEEAIETWLDEIVHDRSDVLAQSGGDMSKAVEAVRQEVGAVTTPRNKWMFELYHLASPNASEHGVLLHLGHALFDGMGAIQALDLWLHELATAVHCQTDEHLQWGEEGVRLAAAMPDRMAIPWTPEPTPTEHFMLQKISNAMQRPPVNVRLPTLNSSAEPTFSGNIVKSFPAPFAEQLRTACRAHGCGIFSAVFAANYLTLLRLMPRESIPSGELFTHIFPAGADLRAKHLSGGAAASRDRSTWQFSLALGGNVVGAYKLERFLDSLEPVNDVWTLAREIQAQLVEQQPYQATAAQWVPEIIMLMLATYSNDYVPASPEFRSVNVASLGVLDATLTKSFGTANKPAFTISDPIISTIGPTLTSDGVGVLLLPYTWDGVFRLSFSFASAYMGTEEEQKLAAMKGIVTMRRYVHKLSKLLEDVARSGKKDDIDDVILH